MSACATTASLIPPFSAACSRNAHEEYELRDIMVQRLPTPPQPLRGSSPWKGERCLRLAVEAGACARFSLEAFALVLPPPCQGGGQGEGGSDGSERRAFWAWAGRRCGAPVLSHMHYDFSEIVEDLTWQRFRTQMATLSACVFIRPMPQDGPGDPLLRGVMEVASRPGCGGRPLRDGGVVVCLGGTCRGGRPCFPFWAWSCARMCHDPREIVSEGTEMIDAVPARLRGQAETSVARPEKTGR